MEHVIHPFPPFYDADSTILILGSFPSVKSREQMFFYGHPQNRFWKVMAAVFSDEIPDTIADKKKFLSRHHVALWDVIGSCDIEGSADASIGNAVPNDLSEILEKADIQTIIVNGKTADRYYRKFIQNTIGREAACLPSTSPANAAFGIGRLVEEWEKAILH